MFKWIRKRWEEKLALEESESRRSHKDWLEDEERKIVSKIKYDIYLKHLSDPNPNKMMRDFIRAMYSIDDKEYVIEQAIKYKAEIEEQQRFNNIRESEITELYWKVQYPNLMKLEDEEEKL